MASHDDDDLAARYYLDLATAFVRGKLGAQPRASAADLFRAGGEAGLRLHKFKRNDDLPRVRRVLGVLKGLAPATILDIGSGRGTFLWPLLDALPDVDVTAIDCDPRRAGDLGAVRDGGITRLRALAMDAQKLAFDARSFDVVTILEVLEHLPSPEAAAAEAMRVARHHVVATVPSKEDDNPEHIHLFDRRSLQALFERAGARRVTIEHVLNHIVAVASVEGGT